MPQINLQMQPPSVNVQVWNIEEPMSYFLQRTRLTAAEQDEISGIHGAKRQLEYLVQRFLLQEFNIEYRTPQLMKTPNGKPVLLHSQFQVSISHSGPMLALSRSRREHGIDLELLDERIIRLAAKFCNYNELKVPAFVGPVLWYTLIWSCKEALYKVDGLGNLDFRRDLATYFTAVSMSRGSGRGIVRRGDQIFYYSLSFEILGDYLFTLAYPMQK